MQVEVERKNDVDVKTLKIGKTFNFFQVIIIDNADSNFKILNKTLCEWLKLSCFKFPVSILKLNSSDNLLKELKKRISNVATFSIVLYSKTPLISAKTLDFITEYVQSKEINICKLPVGYVFRNSFIKKVKEIRFDSIFTHCYDDFYLVENRSQLQGVSEIFRKRIIDYHISNGVNIISPSTTTIEPEVEIENGVDIYSNNTIKGKTYIDKNVILKEGNVISNSIIGCGSCISNSNIENSKIGKNVFIKPFCNICDKDIHDNEIITKEGN